MSVASIAQFDNILTCEPWVRCSDYPTVVPPGKAFHDEFLIGVTVLTYSGDSLKAAIKVNTATRRLRQRSARSRYPSRNNTPGQDGPLRGFAHWWWTVGALCEIWLTWESNSDCFENRVMTCFSVIPLLKQLSVRSSTGVLCGDGSAGEHRTESRLRSAQTVRTGSGSERRLWGRRKILSSRSLRTLFK